MNNEVLRLLYDLFSSRFTNCLVYYGLSLGVGNFTSNLYIGFTLSGLVEIPSNILALITLEKSVFSNAVEYYIIQYSYVLYRIGRKWSNFGFLTLGGGACIACACVQILNSMLYINSSFNTIFMKWRNQKYIFVHSVDSSGTLKLLLPLLGKFSIAASFSVIYTYTPELLPTDVRLV